MKQLQVQDLGLDKSPALFPQKFSEDLTDKSDFHSVESEHHTKEHNGHDDSNRDPEFHPVSEIKPPVTYISVHEDPDFSMSIFIVDRNARIPLHNHPDMHGLLQVVHGSFEVSCFNKVPLSDLLPDILPDALKNRQDLLEKGYIVPVERVLVREPKDTTSGPVILSPDRDNYHEIWNVGNQPAAFLDILAPPYTEDDSEPPSEAEPGHERRHCDFYKVAQLPHKACSYSMNNSNNIEVEKKTSWLQVIPTPTDYFCDFEPYCGPSPL